MSIRGVRRKTAEHLWQAWTTIPHVTQNDKADITELEHLRARFAPKSGRSRRQDDRDRHRAESLCVGAQDFPQFNASIDLPKDEIIYKQFINIGVAVDTDRGLLVPVIRNVDKKNIVELAAELTQLSKKAKEKKLTPAEMEGGTLPLPTSEESAARIFAIVNFPEVAILGCRAPAWNRSG